MGSHRNLRSGKLQVLLNDPEGGVRDPQVHYDGKKILFSYRKGGDSHYHLYEIGVDGTGLQCLTSGPFDDIEPTYLPDGGIMFCSSRARRVVNCWRTPVATLHRCESDGSGLRMVSSNIEHDNTPWVLPDGRVLYMRWEYVDRNQLAYHHLWTANPDGTGQMVYYGNLHPGTSWLNAEPHPTPGKYPGISMLDAKPIPGTDLVVASFSPSHGRPEHMGAVTIVDPANGPDDQDAAVRVSPPGALYRDPYPISENCFLVALDENDLSVKRMQSFVSLQPGETLSCVGCHEQRIEGPHVQGSLAALNRPASRIEPVGGVPDVLDFPRDVQPVLDRHCAGCHNPDRYEGHVDLTGDHTPLFTQSYWTIIQRGLIADGRNEARGNRPPRSIGSSASRLMKLIDGSHYEANLTKQERDTVRLWIETSATYPGTYAALGSGMHPVVFPVKTMERRCGGCHGSAPDSKPVVGEGPYFTFGGPGPALPLVHDLADLKKLRGIVGYFKFGRSRTPQSLCNLTRPDKSLLLPAPLAKDSGGLGLCQSKGFADTNDPDYRELLGAIEAAAARHREAKRFDMPGFRPNDHYLIQLQWYGALPNDCDSEKCVDFRAAEREYWKSSWYRVSSEQ